MLLRLAYRLLTEVSPRLLWKAWWLWAHQSRRAIRAYRRRVAAGQLFPPFLFLALTNACNLRCRGCWIDSPGASASLSAEAVEAIIAAGKRQQCYFYALLGGEPLLYSGLCDLIAKHPECYFQIITNGMFLSAPTVERFRQAGNVTVVVSLDGFEWHNDRRRGPGVFQAAVEGMARLRQQKLLFGVATTVTAENLDNVLSEDYVRWCIQQGAMYLWYYVYRPVGPDPSAALALDSSQMLTLRRQLLALRRTEPILLIDTYWDAEGRAVCPAALGLGFHIGPRGGIEPCPPLSFACDFVAQDDRDVFELINQSGLLREFQQFVRQRTLGCVILECPQELAEFLSRLSATDTSGRNALEELRASTARTSHHLPGQEIPEDTWLYRRLKKGLFFGMGGYG